MKNIIKLIAILAMCFMVVGMLASCNKNEQPVDNNDDNQTSTEPDVGWVTNEKDGTKELYVNGQPTGVIQNENIETVCTDGKHDFTLVCEHLEHEEDANKYDIRIYKCVEEKCGYVEIETKGHDYVHVPEKDVAVSCEKPGYERHECRCGDWKKVNEQNPLGHTYEDFDPEDLEASIADGWIKCPDESDVCPCIQTPRYQNTCERCNETCLPVAGKIPGHVWGEYRETIKVGNPCELPTVMVAMCTVCNHNEEGCLNHKEVKPAPGHVMGEWKWVDMPTETKDGLIKRVCEGRDGYPCDGYETKVVPAYNADVDSIVYPDDTAAYEYSKKDPTCVDAGKHVFVYKVDGKVVESAEDSTFEIKIPAGKGHDITGVEYKWVEDNGMPTATDRTGKIEVECKNCDVVLEFTVTLDDANITKPGNCGKPVDTYTYVFSGKDSNGKDVVGSVKVEFEVEDPNAHPHEVGEYNKETFEGCIPLEDKDGRITYVLLCHNSDGTGCNQYIVVGYKEKE